MIESVRHEIDWDIEIATIDGSSSAPTSFSVLMAKARFPFDVINGPYAKGLHFGEGFPDAVAGPYLRLSEVLRGSTAACQLGDVTPNGGPFGMSASASIRAEPAVPPASSTGCRRARSNDFFFCFRMHRMGWQATMEQREIRPGGCLILRQYTVAVRQRPSICGICPSRVTRTLPRRVPALRNTDHLLDEGYPNQIATVQNGPGLRAPPRNPT